MQNSINHISNLSTSQFLLSTSPIKEKNEVLPSVKEQPSQTKQKKVKDYYNTKTILASLSGLAVIGFGIWKLKSNQLKSGDIIPKNPSSQDALIKPLNSDREKLYNEITNLRKKIQKEYASKKQDIIDKMNDFEVFDNIIPFKTEKELYEKLQTSKAEYLDKQKNTPEIIKKAKAEIKKKIEELKDNSEWIELRKLRKVTINKLEKGNISEDETKILNSKIQILNDLLINRVYPEEMENYEQLFGISDKKAFEFVKKQFDSYEDFLSGYDQIITDFSEPILDNIGTRFSQKYPLKLKYLFPKEIAIIDTNQKSLSKKYKTYEAVNRTYTEYKQMKLELSNEFKKSKMVADLKTLIKKLKALNNESETLKSAA